MRLITKKTLQFIKDNKVKETKIYNNYYKNEQNYINIDSLDATVIEYLSKYRFQRFEITEWYSLLEIYKGLKQEENLRYLATEQYLLLLEKDVIINQLLSEIEQLKEIRLLDEERFKKLKDEIIEQHKKRRISIIGYSGFGYDFVNIRPQIGIGIGNWVVPY